MEQVQELVKLQVVDTQWVLVVFVVPLWVVTVLYLLNYTGYSELVREESAQKC